MISSWRITWDSWANFSWNHFYGFACLPYFTVRPSCLTCSPGEFLSTGMLIDHDEPLHLTVRVHWIISLLYRCLVPGCENKTSTGFVFAPEWLNNTVPWNDMDRSLAQCYKYNHSWTDPAECYTNQPESSLEKCNRWLYDTTMFSSSIVTDVSAAIESCSSVVMHNSALSSLIWRARTNGYKPW